MPKIIAFGNQKGGVGKTTLTSILANYIHHHTDKTVCAVDVDYQQNLMDRRNLDINEGADASDLYDVSYANSDDIVDLVENGVYDSWDYLIIDLPGTIRQEGVLQCYALLDHLFVPTNNTDLDLASTYRFLEEFKEVQALRKKIGFEPTKLHGVWSRVKPNSKEEKDIINGEAEDLGMPFFKNIVKERYQMGRNTNTVQGLDAYGSRDHGMLEHFCIEVFNEING